MRHIRRVPSVALRQTQFFSRHRRRAHKSVPAIRFLQAACHNGKLRRAVSSSPLPPNDSLQINSREGDIANLWKVLILGDSAAAVYGTQERLHHRETAQ